jgi:hypothetical protein
MLITTATNVSITAATNALLGNADADSGVAVHGACRAGAIAQRFDFGITSFSAVCVAENRATFV